MGRWEGTESGAQKGTKWGFRLSGSSETGTEARCRGVGVGEVGSNKVGLGEEGPSSNRRAGDLGTERAQPNLYTELKAAGGTALRRPVASRS